MTRSRATVHRYIAVLGVLAALLMALGLYRDWIVDSLIARLAYFVWLVGLFFRSRPQRLYWALPILGGAGIGILVLLANIKQRLEPEPQVETVGRAANWDSLLKNAERQPFFRKFLRRKLEASMSEAVLLTRRASEAQGTHTEDAGEPNALSEIRTLLDATVPQIAADGRDAAGNAWKPEAAVEYSERMLEDGNDR